jgi:hypothetical protein
MSATVLAFPAKTSIPKVRKRGARSGARRRYRHNLLNEAMDRAKLSSDPIFGAIATHLAAVVQKCDHSDYTINMSFKEEQAEEPISQRLCDLCDETLRTVLDTAPTSLEGLLALLEHVGRQEFLDPDDKTSHRETFLSSYNECCGKWKRFGQDFPLRVAEAVRNMLRPAPSVT